MMTRTTIATTMAIASLLAAASFAQGKKVRLEDLPAAVRATVQTESQGGTVRGLSREVANGQTVYEAELLVNGRTKDIIIDPAGTVVMAEIETTIDDIPAPARAAIEKAIGSGALTRIETVREHDRVYYEAQFTSKKKKAEVKVAADGRVVK